MLHNERNSRTLKNTLKRPLQLEQLEARLTFSVDLISESLGTLFAASETSLPSVSSVNSTNLPPAVARPIMAQGGTLVTRDRVSLSVLGSDDQGERRLTYQWSVVSAPNAANVRFSANNRNTAKLTNVQFNRAGSYTLAVTIRDTAGLTTSTRYNVQVAPTFTRLGLQTTTDETLRSGQKLTTTESRTQLRVLALDQFNQPMALPGSLNATVTSTTRGAAATVQTSGNTLTVNYNRSGNYQFRVSVGSSTVTAGVTVSPKLSSIAITPSAGSIAPGVKHQFVARGLDQFGLPMARQPSFQWSSSSGAISRTGLWTASNQTGNVQITAVSGTLMTRATVSVQPQPNFGGFQNNALSILVQTHFADGSITRPDMIQILRSAGIDGRIDTTELSDLRTLVNRADQYRIPDYVRVLANDVVNANPANATFQGRTLGNLSTNSTAGQLNLLIDKWFYGADRPALTGSNLTYRIANGSLFNGAPSYQDQHQGAVGDCYLISSLGVIAATTPDAIRNMFIDNRDGTYTVRFFTGAYGAFRNADGSTSDGFRNGVGVADYVTVDRYFASTSAGRFAYSNAGALLSSSSNALWIALAEKAYAQWNETGQAGRGIAANSYASIEGGWMSTAKAQVLGYNSSNYHLTNANQQTLIDALNSGKAVTIGTKLSGQSGALVASHAYSIMGYNAQTDQFQLHNPWGVHHAGGMSYSQLQANCTMFVVADASRFVRFSAVAATPVVRSGAFGAEMLEYSLQVDFSTIVLDAAVSDDVDQSRLAAIDASLTAATSALVGNYSPRVSPTAVSTDDGERAASESTSVTAIEQAFDQIDSLFAELAEDEQFFI